jgi:4-diphosphocytidyl-2-C-methyl-D-erythritol kinase
MTAILRETAYAKINLALHVRARRSDGYHDLETLFAFAEDGDRIEAEAADEFSLLISGDQADLLETNDNNLVLRAAEALRAAFGIASGAALRLDKILPIAAGLGGGSADAAATLRILARLWTIDLADPRIVEIAQTLGADVPACLLSCPSLGTGRGDTLLQVDMNALSGQPLLLANPGVALSTGPVFAGWDGIDRGPFDVARWREGRNDLAPAALALVPEIGALLDALSQQPGANFVQMSGSGASCFAIFDSIEGRDAAASSLSRYWTLSTKIR